MADGVGSGEEAAPALAPITATATAESQGSITMESGKGMTTSEDVVARSSEETSTSTSTEATEATILRERAHAIDAGRARPVLADTTDRNEAATAETSTPTPNEDLLAKPGAPLQPFPSDSFLVGLGSRQRSSSNFADFRSVSFYTSYMHHPNRRFGAPFATGFKSRGTSYIATVAAPSNAPNPAAIDKIVFFDDDEHHVASAYDSLIQVYTSPSHLEFRYDSIQEIFLGSPNNQNQLSPSQSNPAPSQPQTQTQEQLGADPTSGGDSKPMDFTGRNAVIAFPIHDKPQITPLIEQLGNVFGNYVVERINELYTNFYNSTIPPNKTFWIEIEPPATPFPEGSLASTVLLLLAVVTWRSVDKGVPETLTDLAIQDFLRLSLNKVNKHNKIMLEHEQIQQQEQQTESPRLVNGEVRPAVHSPRSIRGASPRMLGSSGSLSIKSGLPLVRTLVIPFLASPHMALEPQITMDRVAMMAWEYLRSMGLPDVALKPPTPVVSIPDQLAGFREALKRGHMRVRGVKNRLELEELLSLVAASLMVSPTPEEEQIQSRAIQYLNYLLQRDQRKKHIWTREYILHRLRKVESFAGNAGRPQSSMEMSAKAWYQQTAYMPSFLDVAMRGALQLYKPFEFSQLEIDPKIVARGAVGTVKLAQWKGPDGVETVAVKLIDAHLMDVEKSIKEESFREAAIMSLCNHPNLLSVKAAALTEKNFCLILDLAKFDLRTLLNESPNLPSQSRIRIVNDMVGGLRYLHNLQLIHRDLKSPNVLLFETEDGFSAKVADFGLCRVTNKMMTATQGTALWMAPEIIGRTDYSLKADVYSFGIIMWELMTFQMPFSEFKRDPQFFTKVMAGYRPAVPKSGDSHPYVKLMKECWHQDPTQRPDFNAIMKRMTVVQTVPDYSAMFEKNEEKKAKKLKKSGSTLKSTASLTWWRS